jgi:hypothetical protein
MESVIRPVGTDLSSRQVAAGIRRQIEQLAETHTVIVDLSHVLSISESFADEAFGVLVSQRGLEWLAEHVHFLAGEPIFLSIAQAIRERLGIAEEQQFRARLKALIAGQRDACRHVNR